MSPSLRADQRAQLALWFRALRNERGMSQESVAHAAAIAVSTYSRIERAHSTSLPSTNTIAKALAVLGPQQSQLVGLAEIVFSPAPTGDA